MSTDEEKFEAYYTATRARLQFEADRANPPMSIAVDYELREYFALLYKFAPSLAASPLTAASWLKNAMQTQYVGPSDVAALCRCELEARRVRESERSRVLEAWHILMQDPDKHHARAQAKVDPEEARRRSRARGAVLVWLEHRPELELG